MDATRRARGCLFLVITGAVLVVYMCYGNYGQDQRSGPIMVGEDLVLPAREPLHVDMDHTEQGVSIEQKTSRSQSDFMGDCRQVFPWSHTSINHTPDMKVRKTSIYYCGIPKIGTTFTKILLQKIPACKQKNNDVCEIDVPSAKLTKHAIASSTYSFMWVRDPYSRLFSAYENKLYHPNSFWQILGRPIIKSVRNNSNGETRTWNWRTSSMGYDVTFAEFIRFILQSVVNGKALNIHFRPIHKMCNPCITRFDFIGRLESFSESVAQVCTTIREIGLLTSVNGYITCNSIKSDSYVFSRIKRLFQFLIKLKYIPISIYKELMQRTWSSYQIRGMVSKSLSMPWSDKELRIVTLDQYVDAVRAAMSASSNTTELRAQRREAMLQAYRTVPRADMALLKKFVSTDCRLFGYEQEPPDLFNATQVDTPSTTFDYFNGLLR